MKKDKLIFTPKDIQSPEDAGGKAWGLLRLEKAGVRVPRWVALGADFWRCAQGQGLLDSDVDGKKLKQFLLTSALEMHWRKLSGRGKIPLALRSSALGEDSGEKSFAGQFDTKLYLLDFSQVLDAILQLWRSQPSSHLKAYQGEDQEQMPLALVLQRMVPSEKSGVIFTADPIDGSRDIKVEGVWGLGEALVSGRVCAQSYTLSWEGTQLTQPSKTLPQERLDYVKGRGLIYQNVQEQGPVLLPQELARLLKEVKKLPPQIPWDIEFALYGKKAYLLQVRPITTIKKGQIITWNNANIVESYSGINTPMTYSFIKMAYARVYRQFCEVVGISSAEIERNKHVFDEMLGYIKGRVYYNINHWYHIVSLLPGFQLNKGFLEKMMGIERPRGFVPGTEVSLFQRLFKKTPELLFIALGLMGINFTWEKRISGFFKQFYRRYDYYKALSFDRLSGDEIGKHMAQMAESFLGQWKEPILNDLRCMVFFGLFNSLGQQWLPESKHENLPWLLSGQPMIKSKEVVYRLLDLANHFPEKSKNREIFLAMESQKFLKTMKKEPSFQKFWDDFHYYLDEFGVRAPEEMKLESLTARERPEYVLGILKSYIQGGKTSSIDLRRQEIQGRKKAEEEVRNSLKGQRFFFFWKKADLLLYLGRITRRAIRDRENQRFCRSEVYDLARKALLALGRKWEAAGLLEHYRDIFYLTWEETWAAPLGTSASGDFKSLVKERKSMAQGYGDYQFPGEFVTQGDVALALEQYKGWEGTQSSGTISWLGTGVCAGVVEGEAVVMRAPDPEVDLQGKILVAPFTDPGWVVMFPNILGLAVERGSSLSHSAIVAREMNIPAVVGVSSITENLKKGQRMRLDGRTGQITLLEET